MHSVELQHIGQIIGGAKIVDAHDLNIGMVHAAAHDHTADTAETIDTDFDAHKYIFLSDWNILNVWYV